MNLRPLILSLLFCSTLIAELSNLYTLPPQKDNQPPQDFTALFNGKNLRNWKGLLHSPYDKPHKRQELSPEKLSEQQKIADKSKEQHWTIKENALYFDGKNGGHSLATIKKYKNFELHASWKINPNGDSGIYLRGLPQVQIWDPENKDAHKYGADKGSGSLWNNPKHGKFPIVKADNPAGQWNHFFIRMIDNKVSIWLNGKLTVNDAPLHNLWQPGKNIPDAEQIELQCHGHPTYFKNIFIRELK